MTPVRAMPTDEIHARLADALRQHRLEGWELKFAVAFVSTCKRGREPSQKMDRIAREIVRDLRGGTTGPLVEVLADDDAPLIDGGA